MTNGFAGSKSLDERRRRRLAQEGIEASGETSGARRRKSSRSSASAQPSESATAENSLHLSACAPIKTRLWREPWKYGVLIAVLLHFDVAIVLHANWSAIQASETAAAVNAVESWIVEYLAIGYFALATGFAWLIFHYRSRSRLDFGGRYRLWIWPAMLWSAITVCSLTGWHELCAEWLTGQSRFRSWNARLWCWLIPTAAMLLSSTRLLTYEFTACRVSWRLHLGSVVMAAVSICCVLLRGTSLDGVWLAPTVTLATILWPTLELGSFLLFARHVVHVTNEPTTIARKKRKKKFAIGKLFKRLIAWILTTREELPAYEELNAAKTTRKRSPRRSTKSKSSSRKTRSASRSRVVESADDDGDDEVESESEEMEIEQAPVRVDKPAAITSPRVEKPAIIPQASQAKPVQSVARAAEPIKPTAKLVEVRPATQLRADATQAKRGPHFAQANQRQEREAVAAMRREPECMEDDFGDVDDWDEDDGDAPQQKRMKGKKKRRR